MTQQRGRGTKLAGKAKDRIDAKLGELWWAIGLRGVLALGVAACAFFWPQKTIAILVKLLGAYFLIDGTANAVGTYRSASKGVGLFQPIVSLAVGLVLLVWTGVSVKLFLILVGIGMVLQGIGMFLASRDIESADQERNLMRIVAGVLILIGIVFVVWTNTGVAAISWLIGIAALAVGCLLLFLASRLRRLRGRISNIGQPQ